MKPKLDTIKAFIISFCFSLTYATTVLADDTDIYLGDPDAAIIKPNVLFVLDTSDSMSNEVPGTGKDRLANMRDAMTQLVQDLDNVNVGLMRFNGRRTGDNETPTGGAIIFPVSDLDANLSVLPSETDLTARSLAFTVSDPNDDASETTDTGTVMLNEPSLSINDESTPISLEIPIAAGADNARANLLSDDSDVGSLQLNISNGFKNNFGMGLRFTNLAIPADAQITSAAIKFTARLNGSGVINTIIQGQKDIAPAAFTATDDMEDSGQRPKTSASVSWTPPDFVAAQEYVTDDITPIIEELTDGAAGWVAGSDMVLFVFPVSGDKNAIRQPIRHQDSATLNPRLVINYVLPKQRIATRFQKVNIPQGASITSAYIDFISADPAANQPFPITTQIHAEATDDAAAYSTAPFDISTRTYTGNSVPWTLPAVYTPPLTTNQLITPAADVTSLVQEVVNRPGWCGGNAMAFKFETSQFAGGLKVLKSSDTPTDENNPSGAPVLRVVFDQTAVPPGGGCIRKQLTYQPEHPKDDATQKLSKSKLTLGGELETDNRIVGLRFPGVQLEPDDVIVDAHLELTHILAGTGAIDMTIAGHDAGNLIRFSKFELLNDFLAKPRTTASVPWNIPNDNAQDEKVVSPDLTSIISEIIQDPGNNWSRGNSLGLYLENFTNDRLFHSANTNAALSPRLKLTIETKASSVITVRERMLELINEQTHTLNRTPSIETLLEAAYYWRGENVYYGTHRGQGGFPNGVPNPNDQDTAGDPDLGMNFGRVSHPDSYTGGTLKQSPGCDNTNLDAPECFDEVIDGAPVYNSPMEIGECQNNYMIFLSDGAPTENNEAPALIQAMTGDESCATNSKGNNGACGINLLEYLKEEDQSSTLDGDQTVTTYSIGFNIGDAGNESTVDFMIELAEAGGGEFKSADTAAELSDSLLAIFKEIYEDPSSFAAPALQVNAFNKLQHRDEVYFSLFAPSDTTRWDGNIKKYRVCDGDGCTLGEILDSEDAPAINSNGVIDDNAKSFWSDAIDGPDIKAGGAGKVVPAPILRNIYTYTGATDPVNVDLGDPEHELTIENFDNLDTLLGFADSTISNPPPDPATDDADPDLLDLIQWIRGVDVFDDDDDNNVSESRWPIADPLHGSPVALTYGCQDGVPGTPCEDGGDNAIIKVFITGNDGSVRMLNGNNGTNGGVEEWVFYPQIMLEQQAELALNAENPHLYGIDNTPTVIQADLNGDAMIDPLTGEYIRLYFSMRRGGDSIFALDVTPDSGVLEETDATGGITPTYMWRIDGSSTYFPNLGDTWSRPLPARVRVPKSGGNDGDSELKTVLIFAGGYDEAQDDGFGKSNLGNAIYIVDAETGERIWWASNDEVLDGNSDAPNLVLTEMDYPIPSDIALVDSAGDGAINRLYVGDMGGQIWRIDLDDQLGGPSTGPANKRDDTSGARLAVLSNPDPDPTNVADHRKFFYPPDVIQVEDTIFSSEASYDLVTITSGDRANPLEEEVLNRAYGLRDYAIDGELTETGEVPLRHAGYDIGDGVTDGDVNNDGADLYDTTANLVQVGDDDQQDLATEAMRVSGGWFLDFTDSGLKVGEKGLSSPIVLAGKLFFTTFLPSGSNDPCQVIQGTGRLYGINAITAAAEFEDWLEDGDDNALETGDRTYNLGGGIPSSAVPIFQEKGVTLLIGTGGGAESVDPDIDLPRVRTYWYQQN